MNKRWISRNDYYQGSSSTKKICFRINKIDFSVKMFILDVESNKTGLTNVGFVSDCYTNLEAKYSRLIKNMKLTDKLISREYFYENR